MSVESVRNYFLEKGLEDPVFELKTSGATVELASQTLGIEPQYIAKTLAFKLKDREILVVTRGDAKIDNKKYKEHFRIKAKMLSHDEVLDVTGHPVGGVCPFGLKYNLEVYLDISIKNFEHVYPAAGSQITALKITPKDMESLTAAQWVDICQI
jgi:Cys-tRNA(Pro) deacylase